MVTLVGLQRNCCSAWSPVQRCAVGVAPTALGALAGGAGRAPPLRYLLHHSSDLSLLKVTLWLIYISPKSLQEFLGGKNGWKTGLKIMGVPEQWAVLHQSVSGNAVGQRDRGGLLQPLHLRCCCLHTVQKPVAELM